MFPRFLAVGLCVAAAIGFAGCGGGGSAAPAPTPTPAPGAVVASPNPMTLTVSAGANHAATLNVTQTNAAGSATVTSNCYGGTTAYTTSPTAINFGTNGGVYTGTYSAFAGLAVGSCTITIVPVTGTTLVVPVTVGP